MTTHNGIARLGATFAFSTVAVLGAPALASDTELALDGFADPCAMGSEFCLELDGMLAQTDVDGAVETALDDADAPATSRLPERFQADPEARGYRAFIMRELEYIGELDLYGVSAQLPEGWLKFSWDYGWLKANNRFDRYGNSGPVLSPLIFENNGEEQINVDLDVGGHGSGHTFQVSYGIIDPLDFYIEIPFTAMNLRIDPQVNAIDDDGNRIGELAATVLGVEDRMAYDEEQFLYETFPALGRPTPATGYDGRWLLGDINMGFSWNFFRNSRFSSAWTNRVFLPTGHVPAPETNITYATGPQPEIGVGGWGVSTTTGYDLRLYKHSYWVDIILSTEIGFGYFFKQQRDYPSNFVEPMPGLGAIQGFSDMFPDLSNLEGTFDYTPGFNTSWTAQLNVSVALLNFGFAYGWAHSQKPEMNADPAFLSMVDSLELLGQQSRSEVQIGVSTTLLPLYIPASIGIVRRIMVDGRDTLQFTNFWQLSIETFAPLSMIWDKERRRNPPSRD